MHMAKKRKYWVSARPSLTIGTLHSVGKAADAVCKQRFEINLPLEQLGDCLAVMLMDCGRTSYLL